MAESTTANSGADSHGADGFTVIELMVALVIFGLGIAALTGVISDSLFRATRAVKEAQAARMADAVLARLGADIPVSPGVITGQVAGLDWALRITPFGGEEDKAAWPARPVNVILTLRWTEGDHTETASWRTIRVMAQRAPAQ